MIGRRMVNMVEIMLVRYGYTVESQLTVMGG